MSTHLASGGRPVAGRSCVRRSRVRIRRVRIPYATTAWALIVCTLCAVRGAAAPAQARDEIERDMQELRQYRLTIEKVRQMAAATLAFGQAQARSPEAQARRQRAQELAALEAKPAASQSSAERKRVEALLAAQEADEAADARAAEEPEPRTLSDMTRRIEREPELAKAIREAGLTTREYSIVALSFVQTMIAHGLKRAGTIAEMPKEIPPENIALIQAHEAELNDLFARLQAAEEATAR